MDSTGPPKIPNGEDLNMISDFMNSILHNMPQYYHNIPLNNGLTSDSDNRHLMNISNKVESMLNIKKTIKPGISIKPLNFNKKSIVNINPQNQYRKSSTLMQNLAKKLTQVKSSYNPNKNLKSSKDTLSNQKASPRKMQVVYKENDKYVSRSLSTMLKNTNQTIPLPDNKTRSRKLISAQSKKNFNISHTSTNIQKSPRRISSRSVAKPINIALPLQVVKDTSNSSKNKLLRVDGKVKDLMEKKIHRSKCNMRPISQVTDFTPSGRRSASLNSRNMRNGPSTSNQSKSSSRKIRRGLVANTPKKQEQVKNNKPSHVKSSLETNKLSNKSSSQQPKPILKNPQTENLVQNRIENIIKDQVQNQFKNVIQDKVEKTPLNLEPSANATAKSAPNQSINQDQPKKQVQDQPQTVIQVPSLTQNQNEVPNKTQSQTPAEDKTENRCQSRSSTKSEPKPIKFMKNTDNNNRYQFFAPSSITEQNSIRLINEKLEHLIDKIKEEKEVIRTNLIKQSNADLNENLVTQNKFFLNNNNKNVSNHNNRKQVPVVDSNKIDDYKTTDNNNNRSNNENTNNRSNNENNNNRSNNENNNKKIAHKHNTNRNNKLKSTSSTMSRINKNLPKLPPSVVPIVSSKFGTKLSRQSINNSSVVIKHSNQSHSTLLPRRDRNTMTPMEVVQDFINLVNKAKRDRKTYTVCGNFQSVRKAFTDRGWIEKMRINLIDDPVFKKLENLSNFELVEGIKDRDQGDKYRRIFISKLLSGHQVDFYWDYMQNPFSINNDKIKRTLINRFPFGATKVYTSKAGLCETLKEAYWYYIEGHANIYFPRTYNLTNEEDIAFFTEDFRRTAIISLLQWITKNSDKPRNIISPNGLIQTSIFNFATLQCFNFLKIKEHKDIDEIIPLPREYEWDIFLEKYYKIVHQGQHFKETDQMNAPLIIEQSKYILNKIRKFVPHVDVDGVMNLWLLKPNNGSRGTGIHVCRTLKYTLDTVQSRKETKYVVQKYLERPLLIQNTKFDIRQWFLVTCMPSLQVWLYKDCYLRFSSQHYDLSRLHESIHLTNNSVQCRYKNQNNRSNILPDSNMWHSDTFRKYLNDTGHPSAWKDIIYKGIKECLVGLFMLCQDKIITRVNSFELCGADFMISEDFRPYLIEINSRPALYASTRITAQLCPKVLEDVVKVTIDYARNPKASTGNFELVYKDTFNYIPPKNINSIYIEGISHVKFMNASLPRTPVSDDICDTAFIVKEPSPGPSIEKNLHIDPNKVRKDVKNTLEKILAIIHTEKTTEDKKDNNEDFETPEERNKQFKMMLSEFVDIITSVKVKET